MFLLLVIFQPKTFRNIHTQCQGAFGNIWKSLGLSHLPRNRVVTGICWVEAKDAAYYPTRHSTALHTGKNFLSQVVNSAMSEKPWSTEDKRGTPFKLACLIVSFYHSKLYSAAQLSSGVIFKYNCKILKVYNNRNL